MKVKASKNPLEVDPPANPNGRRHFFSVSDSLSSEHVKPILRGESNRNAKKSLLILQPIKNASSSAPRAWREGLCTSSQHAVRHVIDIAQLCPRQH